MNSLQLNLNANARWRFRNSQQGISLITSLMLLVVTSLLAVSMFRGYLLQEKLAGNTLEKQRSLQAAQSAMNFAEAWLKKASPGKSGTSCDTEAVVSALSDLHLCADPKLSPENVPWDDSFIYTPPGMNVAAGGDVNSTTGDVNYSNNPRVHVRYLDVSADGTRELYEVTAVGYGGSGDNSATVLRSTYAIGSGGGGGGGLGP